MWPAPRPDPRVASLTVFAQGMDDDTARECASELLERGFYLVWEQLADVGYVKR